MSPEVYPRLLAEQPDHEVEQLTRLIERTRAVQDARSPIEARAATSAALRRWKAAESCRADYRVHDHHHHEEPIRCSR